MTLKGMPESRNRLWAYLALVVLVAASSRLLVGAGAAQEPNTSRDEVVQTILRGLEEKKQSSVDMVLWIRAVATFDKEIQTALKFGTTGFVRSFMWAQADNRMWAAAKVVEEVDLNGNKTPSTRHKQSTATDYTAWDCAATYDGIFVFTVTPAGPESDVKGYAQIAEGWGGQPMSEIGPCMGFLGTAELLVAAVKSDAVIKCTQTTFEGARCWYLELGPDMEGERPGVYKLWVAPDLGFTVVHEELWAEGVPRMDITRRDFVTIGVGQQAIWVPKRVTKTIRTPQKEWAQRTWRTEEFAVEKVEEGSQHNPISGLSLESLGEGYQVADGDSVYMSGRPNQ